MYGITNLSSSDALHQSYRLINHNGFDVVAESKTRDAVQLVVNPNDAEVFLYKMDPRSNGFSLSHQVDSEELIPKVNKGNKLIQIVESMGGFQPTPDKPQP